MNHAHTSKLKTTWGYDDSTGRFYEKMRPGRNLAAGEEVFVGYGNKDQSRFFVNYGFTLDDNKEDNHAVLHFNVSEGKKQLLESVQIPMSYDKPETRKAFTIVRDFYSSNGSSSGPISTLNELKVLKTFSDAAKDALSKFETSLEEDYRILAANTYPMYSNLRNCVVMRL